MRAFFVAFLTALPLAALAGVPALAAKKPPPEPAKDAKAVPAPGGGKALELGKFGDWGAYMAGNGGSKVCFALSQPKERAPKGDRKSVV